MISNKLFLTIFFVVAVHSFSLLFWVLSVATKIQDGKQSCWRCGDVQMCGYDGRKYADRKRLLTISSWVTAQRDSREMIMASRVTALPGNTGSSSPANPLVLSPPFSSKSGISAVSFPHDRFQYRIQPPAFNNKHETVSCSGGGTSRGRNRAACGIGCNFCYIMLTLCQGQRQRM